MVGTALCGGRSIPLQTRLLLEFGARIDTRDAQGKTPLDLARLKQQKFPNRVELAEIVSLLEAAEQSQGRGAPGHTRCGDGVKPSSQGSGAEHPHRCPQTPQLR